MDKRTVALFGSVLIASLASGLPAAKALDDDALALLDRSPIDVVDGGLAKQTVPTLPAPSAILPKPINPRHLVLSLGKRRVTLFSGDQEVKSYPVAVGRAGAETPLGEHQISAMYKNPPWKHWDKDILIPGGDPENPLGTRWIGFWSGKSSQGNPAVAGFHGTTQEARSSVGSAASSGCVRMYSENIEELFDLVSLGVTVKVVP